MTIQRIKESTQFSFWVSALSNRSVVEEMMTDRRANRYSCFVLIDRMSERYGLKNQASSFLPIYNPQDDSQWPELLGWLITIAEMETVNV